MRHDEGKGAFVNRHGHRATISSSELDELSIDDEPVESFEPVDTAGETRVSSVPRPPTTWTRRKTLITVGIVAAILLLPVIVGEVITARYRTGAASVSGKLDALIKSDVLPAQKQTTVKSSTLATIITRVDGISSSICDGGLADNIATLYPRAKRAHDDCLAKSGQLVALGTVLKQLESQTRYIESIDQATKTVTAPLKEPFAVVGAQQENWQKARDAIKAMRPPMEWRVIHTTLVEQTGAVADNWSKLNTAQNTQDKAGFEAAEKSLTDSYEAIRTTVTQLQGELKITQARLSTAQTTLRP